MIMLSRKNPERAIFKAENVSDTLWYSYSKSNDRYFQRVFGRAVVDFKKHPENLTKFALKFSLKT